MIFICYSIIFFVNNYMQQFYISKKKSFISMKEDNITNNFINNNNIKDIFYDEINDMWTINLNINNDDINNDDINKDDINYNDTTFKNDNLDVYSIEFIMNSELNNKDDDNFPSFYKFLKEKEKKQLDEKNEFLKKKIEKYENFESTSKDLKLLTSFSAAEWCKTWIYEMVHVPDYFPSFMFQDMFRLRDFSQKNHTKHYFYIGYYPSDTNLKKGPYYIGAFELKPDIREFHTHIIIQNPFYCIDNNYDENKIKNFKKELINMTNDAFVFFKFNNLKDNSDERYYYSWCYDE